MIRMKSCRIVAVVTLAVFAVAVGTAVTVRADNAKSRWVLLSDTHIPGEYDKAQNGYTPNPQFAQARDEILALDAKPAGLIITGDNVFLQGLPEDDHTLAKQLEPFVGAGIAVYPLPGNHDNYENLAANAEKFAFKDTPVKSKQITLVETPNANWFLLDSLEDTKIVGGSLGEEQLRWLAEELDKRPDKPAILAAHHNPETSDGALKDMEKFWEVVKPRKQVKAYIYGHTHVYRESIRDGVHLINLPAMGWRFDDKQPLGWTEATVKPNALELKLHTLDKNHPKNNDLRIFEWQR